MLKNPLKKINALLIKIGKPFNITNTIIAVLVGIAHVYLPLPSIPGLILGCLLSLSGSVIMGLSYYFTSETASDQNAKNKTTAAVDEKRTHTLKSSLFLAFIIPMMLLNSGGCFFGMYTGMLLLLPALALVLSIPLSGGVTLAISLILAIIMTVGTLINSWLQAHHLWEKLKKVSEDTIDHQFENSTRSVNNIFHLTPKNAKNSKIALEHDDGNVADTKQAPVRYARSPIYSPPRLHCVTHQTIEKTARKSP